MRGRPVVDLRAGHDAPAIIDAAPTVSRHRTARELQSPAAVAAVGLIVALAGLPAPADLRAPAEVVAGLLVPGVLFFLGFSRIPELPIRLGASVIAVVASWTGVSTAGFAIRHAISGTAPASDRAVVLMLVGVYLLGLGTLVMMRADHLWRRSRPSSARSQESDAPPPSRNAIEHSSDH